MDRSEIVRRYELATSDEWEFIKDLLLEKIIQFSKGTTSPEQLKGMLYILSIPDTWVEDFYAEKKKVETERN